jgi:hypothetical protein
VTMDDIVKLFLAVLSVFSPLFGLYLVLLPGIKWRQQAKVRVGTPGLLYDCVIWYPLLILRALVILTMLYAFFLLVVGATAMKAFALHWDLSKFYPQFNYAHLIVILLVTVLLNAAIYFNPTSKLLAWVTHRLDHFRFTHGWANAHWQLTHYKTFFAMSIDKNELERLSNSVVAEIDSNGDASPPDRTPHPLGLDIEELANYLFIGFVMEDRMHQLYPNDRNRLNAAWGYLAHVATLRERPFSPSSILDAGRNGILVHDLLRRLAPAHQQGPALPTDDLIRNAVNNAGTHLAAKYKGRAYRMPFGLFHRGPSVTVLTKRLRKLEEFRGGILHVFIKVSVRMQIWPSMKVGAFRYAYNDSMAALFLNSGVLAAPNDTKEIEVD